MGALRQHPALLWRQPVGTGMAVGRSHSKAFCIPARGKPPCIQGGYPPSRCPTSLDYLGPLFLFFFWNEKKGAAIPSSLLDHVCLGHCHAAMANSALVCHSQARRLASSRTAAGKRPLHGAPVLHPCFIPCKQGRGLQEEGGCQHSTPCVWSHASPPSPCTSTV